MRMTLLIVRQENLSACHAGTLIAIEFQSLPITSLMSATLQELYVQVVKKKTTQGQLTKKACLVSCLIHYHLLHLSEASHAQSYHVYPLVLFSSHHGLKLAFKHPTNASLSVNLEIAFRSSSSDQLKGHRKQSPNELAMCRFKGTSKCEYHSCHIDSRVCST